MTDTLLVPAYRGVLHAHIERGVHWSEIEHLILWCLTRDAFSIKTLAIRCRLTEGVIVEAIVRLMRVGWVELVELPDRIAFEASAAGRVEAEKEKLRPLTRTAPRNLHFVIDKVVGGVLGTEGLVLVKKRDLEKGAQSRYGILSARLGDAELPDYVELIDKLSAEANVLHQDEKIVGLDPTRSSCDPDWFVRVRVSGDHVEGLPATGADDLRRYVIGATSVATGEKPLGRVSEGVLSSSRLVESFPVRNVEFSFDDIIMGGSAHERCLREVLGSARRRVIVHSTFITKERIERQIEFLKSAAKEGVRVSLLWDRVENDEGDRDLGRFRKAIKTAGLSSAVWIGDFPTRSHAKFLLSDDGKGGYQVVIGSCNWFRSGFTAMETSVRLRCPLCVSDFLRLLEKMIPTGVRQSELREEVVALALELRRGSATQSGTARVQLLPKGAHEEVIREVREKALRYVLVGSNKAGNATETQVLAPLSEAIRHRPAVKVRVYYQSRKDESELSEEVLEELKKRYSGIEIRAIKRTHAKVLCWDHDNVVITSLNWLSKDASPTNPNGEIGVLIRQAGVGDFVKQGYLRER